MTARHPEKSIASNPAIDMTASLHPIPVRACAVPGLRPFLRPIAQLLIAAQLALVLQPLSALAQPKGQVAPNPVAEAQLKRYQGWSQKISDAQAQKLRQALSPTDLLPENLQRVQQLAHALQSKSSNAELKRSGQNTSLQLQWSELQGTLQSIRGANGNLLAEMAETSQQLKRTGATAAIMERQVQAERQVQERIQQFESITSRLVPQNAPGAAGSASGNTGIASSLNVKTLEQPELQASAPTLAELERFAQQNRRNKSHTPLDAKNLPWSAAKSTPRTPAETPDAWAKKMPVKALTAGRNNTKSTAVQAKSSQKALTVIANLQFTDPPTAAEAPTLADLAETAEVQLTPAIKAKAQELGHNPVAIQNWVRNSIEWIPTWGALQSADSVLVNQKGNAHDISSLTIALLRASNVPARYQWGTIELPADTVMNWVGGVSKPNAALNLLYQGGIAARGVVSAGRIQSIRMEHVWVNAYVNYAPSRGALAGGVDLNPVQHVNPNAALNAWVPVDGSFKQYTYAGGMDLKTAVPLDAQALLDASKQGATVNEAEGWVRNLNQQALQGQIATYQGRVKSYLDNHKPNATVGDVIGRKIIPERIPPMLAGTTSYPVIAQGAEASQVPEQARWKISLQLYQSLSDYSGDSPSISQQYALSQISNQRVAIGYEPATAADQAAIDTAAVSGTTNFSAYSVRFKPRLRLDLATQASGYAQQPGEEGKLVVVIRTPGNEEISRSYKLTSGDLAVLSVNSNGIPASVYQSRAETHELTKLNPDTYKIPGLAEEMLHQIGLAWWAQKTVAQDNAAGLNQVVYFALPSHALVLSPISVRYSFGVPRLATYKSRTIDGKLDLIAIESKTGDQAIRKVFAQTAGRFGSYMEGGVFDQAFSPFVPTGVSTISLLAQAGAAGQKIYRLKPGMESTASGLGIEEGIKSDILNALAVGREVIVHEKDVTLGGYTGMGYIIEDPLDGSAAYQIDGGRSGGEAAAMPNVAPLPQTPDNNLIGIMLGSLARQANAKLAVDSGQIIGLVMPTIAIDAGVIAAIIALMIVYLLLTQALKKLVEITYPRNDGPEPEKKWRKYTKFQDFIVRKQLLYASKAGTFAGQSGVYVADQESETQRGVTCATMDPVDIANRFEIPSPQKPEPEEVTGFIDVVEKYKNYLTVTRHGPNSHGQLEYKIVKPIVMVTDLRPGTYGAITPAVIIVNGYLEIYQNCP